MTTPLDQAERLLADLVSFPTVTGLPNSDMIAYIKDYLEHLGISVMLDPHEDGVRFNLFATIGSGNCDGIILSGHTDVVPATGDGWSRDPFVLHKQDGRLYGRGAVDMKGFLATALAMAPAFKAAEDKLTMPLHYAFTFDEEVGSFGAAQMPDFLRRMGIKPAMAIIGEPTGMRPFIGHKGGLELVAEIRGSAGHASDPRGKVNALYYAARLITHIEQVAARLADAPVPDSPFDPPYTTLSVGHIEGGEARNIVPDYCRFLWEIRPLPGDDAYAILADIKAYIADELAPEMQAILVDAGISITEISWCPGMEARASSSAASLIARLWTNEAPAVVSFGTDGGHYQQAGMETIVFGPGGMDEMHQPDEFIEVDAIKQGLAFLENLLRYAQEPPPQVHISPSGDSS
ncbi:acetylornithine deacetylase [Candidatus Puniceispirillum sp.]|uniref:acetylornithine deacetylase n=1 Tax=Candidatus Puniceispirillum sp. TaxID=2026719 RepID=UPI003F695C15